MGVRVAGGRDLAKLANELKLISGGNVIRRELLKEIKKIPRPLIQEIRRESRRILPSENGLAAYIAGSTYKTQVSIRANTARIDLVGYRTKDGKRAGRVDVKRIDAGRLRHPTYGHVPWTTQDVAAGYFTKPTEASGDDLKDAVVIAMESVIKRIT